MNEVKKVILFLLCCAIPFSFYGAQNETYIED